MNTSETSDSCARKSNRQGALGSIQARGGQDGSSWGPRQGCGQLGSS